MNDRTQQSAARSRQFFNWRPLVQGATLLTVAYYRVEKWGRNV